VVEVVVVLTQHTKDLLVAQVVVRVQTSLGLTLLLLLALQTKVGLAVRLNLFLLVVAEVVLVVVAQALLEQTKWLLVSILVPQVELV
jgi:hypothetical protein